VYGGASVSSSHATLELVGLGVDGVAEHPKPSLARGQSGAAASPQSHREACFSLERGYERVPVYAHAGLAPGQQIRGPAFVQSDYLTMLVLPGQLGTLDDLGNLVLDHARGRFVR